jgi:hypothetical protein
MTAVCSAIFLSRGCAISRADVMADFLAIWLSGSFSVVCHMLD